MIIDTRRVVPLAEAVAEFERQYIQLALTETDGRRGRAAMLLGISRKSLWEKLREYNLVVETFEAVGLATREEVRDAA